jgi:hypothetical protein
VKSDTRTLLQSCSIVFGSSSVCWQRKQQPHTLSDTPADMKAKIGCIAALAACILLFTAQDATARQFGVSVSSSAVTAAVDSAAATAALEASTTLEDAGNRPWFCR